MLRYTPTPTQELHDAVFDKAGVRVLVKREDLNHPYVSGNKWWKLKYNLAEARVQRKKTLLTFGGAYSNHIYATAAAARELGFESIGIIRGEETCPLNPTLAFAKSRGMRLHYISRVAYRRKQENEVIDQLRNQFGDFYLIPEGGTNDLAVNGVEEFAGTLGNDFDYLCCAVGTGGTLAGLIKGVSNAKHIIGFPVLRGAEFLIDDIGKHLETVDSNWKLNFDYHFGGYAKSTSALQEFIKNQRKENNLPLDHVYTAKLTAGVFDLAGHRYFNRGSVILLIHTGGLQSTS
jgi:1-aminocyclopropane-1-carboxylate deaminase